MTTSTTARSATTIADIGSDVMAAKTLSVDQITATRQCQDFSPDRLAKPVTDLPGMSE